MIVNAQNLDLAFRGFQTVYTEALAQVPDDAARIAMTVASVADSESYGWLGMAPGLREWVGPRVVNALKAHGFKITNKLFESTVAVKRTAMEDDRLGVYAPLFQLMAQRVVQHKQEMVFNLLKSGFTALGFDGQPFFSDQHSVEVDNVKIAASNFGGGSGTPWFLLDASKPVRPIIWQERVPYEFQSMNDPNHPHVFMNDEFTFGVRARLNAGFGLWQLAYASKDTLTGTTYGNARAAMMAMKTDGGAILGVTPTVLVVPPSLESAARQLLNSEFGTGGISNEWKGTAELIVTPFLA